MIGIVVVTHGSFSSGLKDAAEVIFGEVKNIETLSLKAGENVEGLSENIQKAIHTVDQGNGVIVFVDIASASPYNQSLLAINSLDNNADYHVISGVNLPMLMDAINHQLIDSNVSDAVESIVSQATTSVTTWNIKNLEVSDEDDDF